MHRRLQLAMEPLLQCSSRYSTLLHSSTPVILAKPSVPPSAGVLLGERSFSGPETLLGTSEAKTLQTEEQYQTLLKCFGKNLPKLIWLII